MSTPDTDATAKNAEDDSTVQAKSPAMSRYLQTFGSPDLEVTVGKNDRLYRYHSFILASQSLYVDTLLSSPAAKQEQERGRISFPDIEVETWEKMVRFLTPGAVQPTLTDMLEIVPLYDKYQFLDGLSYLDDILCRKFPEDELDNWSSYKRFGFQELCQLISLIWPLNCFPLSKPVAVQWATLNLKFLHCLDAEMLRMLLPLVENDEKVIKSMMTTYLGRVCKGKTMNEMRDTINQPDFPEECLLRCKQIKDLDDQRYRLQMNKLDVSGCDSYTDVNGKYKFCNSSHFQQRYTSPHAWTHYGGAMVGYWYKESEDDEDEVIIIESQDVYGNVWEIYACLKTDKEDDDGENEHDCENKTVLARWDGSLCSSLIPPKYGWKISNEDVFVELGGARPELTIKYDFKNDLKPSYS